MVEQIKKKTLFVDDKAPPELKENVSLSQECLDNMMPYKEKAENGTLTFDDLKGMAQKNHEIIDRFPKGDATKAGLPGEIKSLDELKDLAKRRAEETRTMVGDEQPVISVSSIRELHDLCKKPPEEIAGMVLDAAEKKAKENPPEEPDKPEDEVPATPTESPSKKSVGMRFGLTKIGHSTALEDELFDNYSFVYRGYKPCFFDLIMPWPELKDVERQLFTYIGAFDQNRDDYISNLFSITLEAEDAVLAGLIYGSRTALERCRTVCDESFETSGNLPLYLACSGDFSDLNRLRQCLSLENPPIEGLRALGLYGCIIYIPELIELLNTVSHPIESEEDYLFKKKVFEVLELLTKAGLEQSFPDIENIPDADQQEMNVVLDFYDTWKRWWAVNGDQFDVQRRYRRGSPFTLESCLKEMEYPMGPYWSRQCSYYELMIRSGKRLPFEADWYVNDQIGAIKAWYELIENDPLFSEPIPWRFAGE